MNFEDEDYVRFYTRETITWLAMEYEGQVVLSLMLHGKFSRSGIFDCGGHEPSHAVTLATRCPPDVAKAGLQRLLDTKTWVLNDGKIIWPNYVHAQTCRRSDRSRKRESRENLAREALGDKSHAVTRGHTRSHAVTPKPRPKPSRSEPKPKPSGEKATHGSPTPLKPSGALSLQQRAQLWVSDIQRATLEAPQPWLWPEVLDLDHRLHERFGTKRLVEITDYRDPRVEVPIKHWAAGVTQQQLLDAIDGAALDPYVKANPGQQSVRWILANAERIQEMIGKKSPTQSVSKSNVERLTPEALERRRKFRAGEIG